MEQRIIEEPLIIRYNGRDADKHTIELGALAESIKGLEKIISVAGNFAVTEQYVKRKDAMQVRVLVAPPKAGSFELSVMLEWINQSQLASTVVGGLVVGLISYIFSRNARNKEEMKQLRGALETAIKELGNRDQTVIDRLLDTVDRMADSLRPSVRQAVRPIGETVTSLSINNGVGTTHSACSVGIVEKDVIMAEEPQEIVEERIYKIRLHEMNKDNNTCRVSFDDDEEVRISATISDPCISMPENAYIKAFATHTLIVVKAKAAIKDGDIEKLYISDTVKV